VSLLRTFGLLVQIFGRVLAQIICMTFMVLIFGAIVRAYVWIDSITSFKLDPVKTGLAAAIMLVVFAAWRAISAADLDE